MLTVCRYVVTCKGEESEESQIIKVIVQLYKLEIKLVQSYSRNKQGCRFQSDLSESSKNPQISEEIAVVLAHDLNVEINGSMNTISKPLPKKEVNINKN